MTTIRITLDSMTDALRPLMSYGPLVDLLGRLPFSRRSAAAFIDRQGDELEAMLGRRPVVNSGGYTKSKSTMGNYHGFTTKMSVRWESK